MTGYESFTLLSIKIISHDEIFPIRILPEGYPDNADLPGFASVGDIPQGSFFAYTFAVKGVFGYYNEKNNHETGTIIVR